MIEVELKFKLKVGGAGDFMKKMSKLGISIQPRWKETTTMFDNEDQVMEKTDGRLRLRTGWKNTLSYKLPITREGVKKEVEFEVEIKQPEPMRSILSVMSYSPVSGYSRFRAIWKLGKCKVFLDEFSFGDYVEIEGEEEAIKKVAKKLGFKMEDNITQSYDGIYKQICEENSIKPKNFFN